jgi:hypothetical protein
MRNLCISLTPRCTNPGGQVVRASKFFTVALNICESSGWSVLLVTLLVSKMLM